MSQPSAIELPGRLYRWWRGAALLSVIVVFGALALRQHRFVHRHAVNVLFWDQWDFYTPFFADQGWWEVFSRQHGNHRQGIGFLITWALAWLGGWDTRWDAYGVSFLLIGAAGLAMRLAWRCGARFVLALAVVPLLFFNIRQYEHLAGPSNLSHAAMPIVFFMSYSLAWFDRSGIRRLALLSLLTFLLIFTGYGFFVGFLTPVVLLVEAVQAYRAGRTSHLAWVLLALAATGVSWVLFAWHYAPYADVGTFRSPFEKPLEHLYFVGLMLANFHGIPGHEAGTIAFGLLMTALLVAVCVWHGLRIIRQGVEMERRSVVIFGLAFFVLIYCASTSMGRAGAGLETGPSASRYVTLMIPAGLALFLHAATLASARLSGWLCFACFLSLTPTLALREADWQDVQRYHDGRQYWKAAYLATHDEVKANEQSHFRVYPQPGIITSRLKFLEEHHLNLFKPTAKP